MLYIHWTRKIYQTLKSKASSEWCYEGQICRRIQGYYSFASVLIQRTADRPKGYATPLAVALCRLVKTMPPLSRPKFIACCYHVSSRSFPGSAGGSPKAKGGIQAGSGLCAKLWHGWGITITLNYIVAVGIRGSKAPMGTICPIGGHPKHGQGTSEELGYGATCGALGPD